MPRGTIQVPLPPPILGIRSDLPKHLIPDGFLADGQNVLSRNGVLIVRPGFAPLTGTAPSGNRVMGGVYYKDHAQTERVFVGTLVGFHLFNGTGWTDPGGTLTGTANDQVRFAVYPLSNTTRVIAVNDVDAPLVFSGSANFDTLGGSPPIAKCVTVAFQRVILGNVTVGGTRRGSSLWVSGFQDPTSWPPVNQADLPDTGDVIVELRALNTQSFAIYKEFSQWIGIGAGGIYPFVYELRGTQPGPISPGCVVAAEDVHYYVGNDGNIYRFDGQRVLPLGSHVKNMIRADINWANKGQAHGAYDPNNREICWFWPSVRTPDGFGGIIYRLPYENIPEAFSPLMQYSGLLTASWNWSDTATVAWSALSAYRWGSTAFLRLYPSWDSFPIKGQLGILTGDSTGQVHRFNRPGGDNGYPVDAYWEFPMRPIAGEGARAQIDVIDAYFKNPVLPANVEISLVTSDFLGDAGTYVTPQTVDISASGTRLRASYANVLAKFVSVQFRLKDALALNEYRGGTLYAYKRGES